MRKPVEWIQAVVGLCFKEEQEKEKCFSEMEKEYLQFSDQVKNRIREIMMTQFEARDMVYVLSVVVQYMKSRDFQEDLMKNILKGDFDCYAGSVIGFQCLRCVEGQYKRKRLLYKKNMTGYDKMLGLNYPYVPMKARNKKRIVIVTGQLLGLKHSPTLVVLNMAYALQKYMGYEILLFICPCNGELPEGMWYEQYLEMFTKEWEQKSVKVPYRGTEFQGYQISMRPDSPKEYSMMVSLIYAWNPMFVLDADTSNPVVGVVNKFTTLVSLTMSIECPISEGEILVRLGRMDDETEKEYADSINSNQKQLFMKEKFPVIAEMGKRTFTREELGLPENQFLITVVGNHLKIDIDEEFVQVMRRILEDIPNAAFVVIGNAEEVKEYYEDKVFEGRIYYLGYCEDLMGGYGILDLYLNPGRMGGGFSGGMALQADIPVVTLPDCDVAYNCGENFVVQDYVEMIETVKLYAGDRKFYDAKKEAMKKYNEEDKNKKLIQYMEELLSGVNEIMGENSSEPEIRG